jgi:UDP-N-acetylmuramoyl-L-alanyl-D-glutamate--2,6-diaminopimelate ligase
MTVQAIHLHMLLHDYVGTMPVINPVITGLSSDSRSLKAGDMFVALKGGSTHGLKFAPQALQTGVSAIIFEPPAPADFHASEKTIAVENLREKLGAVASRFFSAPSQALDMVGVTGTNGKTSTVQLLAQALSLMGSKAGTIGTLGTGIYGQLVEGERTTPDVISVHAALNAMHEQGAVAVAMEVSSHALDQGRVDGVEFDVAVFTNLTRDHLDYHGSMEAYGAAKAKLFTWKNLQAAVINCDDTFGAELIKNLSPNIKKIGFSSRANVNANLQAKNVQLSASGIRFELQYCEQIKTLHSPLLGRFNVDNLLAVAGALLALGQSLDSVANVLPKLSPVDGRMSRVGGENGQPLVVVDYAHTPDALEQALANLRLHTAGKLICVFGCGGDRDRGKRPLMGAIAERAADVAIITDDNPRTENGDAIVAEIKTGFQHSNKAHIIRHRADAIAKAIHDANANDVVLIAGKGHETYQEIAGVKMPFDDLSHARIALEQRA